MAHDIIAFCGDAADADLPVFADGFVYASNRRVIARQRHDGKVVPMAAVFAEHCPADPDKLKWQKFGDPMPHREADGSIGQHYQCGKLKIDSRHLSLFGNGQPKWFLQWAESAKPNAVIVRRDAIVAVVVAMLQPPLALDAPKIE